MAVSFVVIYAHEPGTIGDFSQKMQNVTKVAKS